MNTKSIRTSFLIFLFIWACSSDDDPSPAPNSPVILEINPTEGLPGVTFTIEGVHFSPEISDLSVTINGVEAEVMSSDTFHIEAVVPEGATTGTITVTVKDQTVTSSEVFTVLESPWERKADFGGGQRIVGVGFAIGNKGYAGTGVGDATSMQNDFWEYDPATDTWTQLADFAGPGTQQAIGFSIGNMGYLGLGIVGGYSTSVFYQFDPGTNTWTQKANFAGNGRSGAVAFSIGDKGYVSTGASSYEKFADLWEYDPSADTWTQKADYPGGPKYHAIGFSIGNKGYVGGGSANGSSTKDFWEYDPATDSWTQKADFPDGTVAYSTTVENRSEAVAFAIGGKGYVCTGLAKDTDSGTSYRMSDLWEYDPATDTWTELEDFPGGSRSGAFGFAIGDKGYLGCGRYSDDVSDFWELSF